MTSTAWESPPDPEPGDESDRVTCADCGDHYHAADPKGPDAAGRCDYCHTDLDRTCRICDGRDGQHGPGCQHAAPAERICPRLAYVRELFAAGRVTDAAHWATTDEPLPVRGTVRP